MKPTLSLLFFVLLAVAQAHGIKRDQQIVFFPTFGWQTEEGWELEVRGCVYELESRWAMLGVLRRALGLGGVKMSDSEKTLFAERGRLFLVDHERGKRVTVRIGEREFVCEKSGADGRFDVNVRLSDAEARSLKTSTGKIRVAAVLPKGDSRIFAGDVALVSRAGLTVISDIDDTIKITEVRNRNATLRNTFLKPFEPVPELAALYADWAKAGAQFHYVSASPGQLLVPLAEFVRTNGFPMGALHLKTFRWKNQTFFSLFADPEKYKLGVIEPLFEKFPERRFVLVGDSGERDPEIYAALARKYPKQVVRILIRDVTSEKADSERYEKTFRGLPDGLWQIFREPSEVSAGFLGTSQPR